MRKVDQGPSSPMLQGQLHQRPTLTPFCNIVSIEVDVQLSAGIDHDRRSFDRHYELLFLAKDIKTEYELYGEIKGAEKL